MDLRIKKVCEHWRRHTVALAAIALSASICAAQADPSPDVILQAVTANAPAAQLPEAGLLSSREYRNAFYDFSLDLPEAPYHVQLHSRPMQRGIHPLLGMSFPDPPISTEIWITAFDHASGKRLDPLAAANEIVADIAAKRDKLGYEPLPIHPEKKGPFQIVEQFKYADKRVILDIFFTRAGNLIKLSATTTEPDRAGFKAWLLNAIHLDPPPSADTSDAKPYFGPTLPDAIIERTIATKPGRSLPADHRIQGANYINDTVGFRYRFPFQWKVQDPNAPQPKFFQVDAAEANAAARQHELFNACSRPLLRLTGPKADASQSLSLIALDQQCLGISFPTSDPRAINDFSQTLLEFPDFGEVRSADYTKVNGHPFLVVRSLIADQKTSDGMRGRLMQTTYITQQNGQMLLWFFAARSESTLPTFSVDFIQN